MKEWKMTWFDNDGVLISGNNWYRSLEFQCICLKNENIQAKIRENVFSLEKHFSLKTWKKRTIYRERVRIMKKLLFKKFQVSPFCQIDKNYCTATVWKHSSFQTRFLPLTVSVSVRVRGKWVRLEFEVTC